MRQHHPSQAVRRNARRAAAALAAAAAVALGGAAQADKIANPTAVFAGLDKITGRTITFDVAINETVQFGSLQITPRVCYSRPPTEAPQTDVFAQVDELGDNKTLKRIFSGWMFAASPGLNGIEHPVYDIWLKECTGGSTIIHEAPTLEASAPDEGLPPDIAVEPGAAPADKAKLRPRPRPRPRISAAPTELRGGFDRQETAAPTRQYFPDRSATGKLPIGR